MGVYYEKGDWVICTLQVVYNEPGPKFSFLHNFKLHLLALPVSLFKGETNGTNILGNAHHIEL
jgi:hypothetical protein